MTWETVLKIIGAAILSAGGAGAIIVSCVKFAADHLANRMLQKYDAKLTKDIEQYKHELEMETEKYRRKSESLTFVTKTQFETEFRAYQIIFECMYDFETCTAMLYPLVDWSPSNENEQREVNKKRFLEYRDAYNKFSEVLEKNAPFIPEENYNMLNSLRNHAHAISIMYPEIRIDPNPTYKEEDRKIELENYKKTEAFCNELHEVKNKIRAYLATLKVEKE